MSFNAKNTSGILFMSKLKLTIAFVIVVKILVTLPDQIWDIVFCKENYYLNNFGNSLLS